MITKSYEDYFDIRFQGFKYDYMYITHQKSSLEKSVEFDRIERIKQGENCSDKIGKKEQRSFTLNSEISSKEIDNKQLIVDLQGVDKIEHFEVQEGETWRLYFRFSSLNKGKQKFRFQTKFLNSLEKIHEIQHEFHTPLITVD